MTNKYFYVLTITLFGIIILLVSTYRNWKHGNLSTFHSIMEFKQKEDFL